MAADVIDVDGLRVRYRGAAADAVDGMSFRVPRGEVFGFLGPSGAGKSTVQKVLTGLHRRYQGRVSVLGRPLADWRADYYERIGVGFELPAAFGKLTALENLRAFARLYRGPVEDPVHLLELVGLEEAAGRRVSAFSKGMRLRLNLARALLNRPQLLFLDEPTSGMDPRNARIVKDMVLERKSRGETIFLTTHDMATAEELCDRVAFVIDGRIAIMDSPTELKLARSKRTVRVDYRPGDDGALDHAEFGLDGLADDPEFHALLRGHKVEALHSQEANLNDVFVEATGRSLS